MSDDHTGGSAGLWQFLGVVATGAIGAFVTVKNFGLRVAAERGARHPDNDAVIGALERAQTRADARLAERDLWEARARRADQGWHDCRHALQNLRQRCTGAGSPDPGPEPPLVPRLEDKL